VCETSLGTQAPAEPELVCRRHDADRGAGHQGEVGDIGKRGAERDHLLHILGPPLRQDFGQESAAAVTDEGYRRVIVFTDLRHAVT